MKIMIQKKALSLTQKIMEEWYHLNLKPVVTRLDENASWIGGAAGQFYIGKANVLKGLEMVSSHMVACSLSAQTYEVVDCGADWCIIAGNFTVTLKTPDMLMSEIQRLTFVWRTRQDQLFISHMHVSNNAAEVAPDEEFPIKASRAAYEYISQRANHDAVSIFANDRTLYKLERNEVLYLSAANEYMIVHSKGGDIRVHDKLSKIQEEIFPEFIKIHRSYSVNFAHVRSIRKYEALLTNGIKLPISRERYIAVCEKLGISNK